MDMLWSPSTTMRNPERMVSFLQTASEIEGEIWNHETQMRYQILLIRNRFYEPNVAGLSEESITLLKDYSYELTYEEATRIFVEKNYVGTSMRGRNSLKPIEKLGLVGLIRDDNGQPRVRITEFGRLLLDGRIDLGEVVFRSLLKTQFPDPRSTGREDYCIKPFIGVMHLIRFVNAICDREGEEPVGISREEFGIFGLSLKHFADIESIAERLFDFRQTKRGLPTEGERIAYVTEYIQEYLANFRNPEKNILEYSDNVIRYLRLTRYIYIRGGGYFIDLEPRRAVEINALLDADNAAALDFSREEYEAYMADLGSYSLPFETAEHLTLIAGNIIEEINMLASRMEVEGYLPELPESVEELNRVITTLRELRNNLTSSYLTIEYQDVDHIDETITALTDLLSGRSRVRRAVELERWVSRALYVLNDAEEIRPNAPLGDDNEPIFTAPAGVPDIECFYSEFGIICEVTMLTSRDQWFNEGQPVMRHLRAFEDAGIKADNYCLFVAPRIHNDTLNTFWTSVKYEYEGRAQKIVPVTISDMINILTVVREIRIRNGRFTAEQLKDFLDRSSDVENLSSSLEWREHIQNVLNDWLGSLIG